MEIEEDYYEYDECEGWFDENDDAQVYEEPQLENHDSSSAPKLTSGFGFKIIDERQVSDMRQQTIDEVKEILGIEEDKVHGLLIINRFNKDQTIQSVLEGDQEMKDETEVHKEASNIDAKDKSYLCPVCYCDYNEDELTIAPCSHFLCNT